MGNIVKLGAVFLLAVTIVMGCQKTTVVTDNPLINPKAGGKARHERGGSKYTAMDGFGLATEDFEYAAQQAVVEFMESPSVIRSDGGRWLVTIGEVVNDTTFRIDTRSMTSRMRNKLINSGRFNFTGATGQERTSFVSDSRQLEKSALFDKSTVAKQGTVLAPDLELAGMIRQRTNISGDRRKQRLEYEFDFRAIDSKTGMIMFSTLVDIKKLGPNDKFAW